MWQAVQYAAYGDGSSGGNPQQQHQQVGGQYAFAQQQPPQVSQQSPGPGYGQVGGAVGGPKPQMPTEYDTTRSGGGGNSQGGAAADGQAPPPAASGTGPAHGHASLHQVRVFTNGLTPDGLGRCQQEAIVCVMLW